MSLWSESCFLAASWQSQHLSVKKKQKNEKKIMRSKWSLIRPNCVWRHLWSDPIALEVASDQTKVRSNPPMIRPNCARNFLWSDPSALESAYDQTFQTKMTSDQTISRPWSDRSALELPKRPCNFGLGTHGCALDWVWSEVNLGLDLNLGCGSKICSGFLLMTWSWSFPFVSPPTPSLVVCKPQTQVPFFAW